MKIPHNATHIKPGTLVNERYLIVRLIGQGGMGAVYEATDQRLKGNVALKQTTLSDQQSEKAFEREAHLLARLRHPALPKVIDYFSDHEGQFLVMEFFPGDDLAHMLTQRGEPFAVAQVLDWADQLLAALHYLHQQHPPVIHRDIKPQNLKLTSENDIVLLDFGLAKGHQPGRTSHLTSSGSILGYTPMYAPLEQIQGTGTDPRSDLYALAATLHHLLTSTPPIDTLTRAAASVNHQPDPQPATHTLNPQVSRPVSDVLAQAMRLAPDERPSNASTMRDMLHRARHMSDHPQPHTSGATTSSESPAWNQETRLGTASAPSTATSEPSERHAYVGATIQQSEQMGITPAQQAAPTAASASPSPIGYEEQKAGSQYRSFFWPILLIGIGVVWLLHNLGIIERVDFGLIFRMWPIYLIMIGIDMLTGKRVPWLNALLGSLAAVLVIALLVFAPALGLSSAPFSDVQQEQIVAEPGAATLAEMELRFSGATTVVSALDDSPNLLEADLTYQGELEFDPGDLDDEERSIELDVSEDLNFEPFELLDRENDEQDERTWNIGLTPDLPLELEFQSGFGRTVLDLQDLELLGLDVQTGLGDVIIHLPAASQSYNTSIRSGAGSFEITIADEAAIEELDIEAGAGSFEILLGEDVNLFASIDGGAGSFSIDIPDDAAVKLEASTGFGTINRPDTWERIEGDEDGGIWQSPGFDRAEYQIVIEFDGGSGNLEIE